MGIRQGHEMSQSEVILAAFRRGERLTQLDALQSYGVGRLAARVCDLRAKGYDIRRTLKAVAKAGGGSVRVAEYYLVEREAA